MAKRGAKRFANFLRGWQNFLPRRSTCVRPSEWPHARRLTSKRTCGHAEVRHSPMATCKQERTNGHEEAMMLRTCLTASMYDATHTQRCKQQEPCDHDCMMHDSACASVCAHVSENGLSIQTFYGQSDHAGTRVKRNKSTEVISVGLAMCCNDGWWNDAARQMQEKAPLEHGRHVCW